MFFISESYGKGGELPGRFRPGYLRIPDIPFKGAMELCEHLLENLLLAFADEFYASVVTILHPTHHRERLRHPSGRVSESDPLNVPREKHVNTLHATQLISGPGHPMAKGISG
jgi:hypothetical protein